MAPTIEDLKALQRKLNLLDVHVVWLGPDRFVIAHTDEERATIDLEECALHRWLADEAEAELAGLAMRGYYVVTPREFDRAAQPWNRQFDFTKLVA